MKNKKSPLYRIDPIDEHEMKIILVAIRKAKFILEKIPFRKFKITITEL